MTPSTIIRKAHADGVMLVLSPAGNIKAVGDRLAVNRWLAVIRERKAEVVSVLKAAVGAAVPPVPPKNHTAGIEREAFEERAADLESEDGPVQVDPFIERRDRLLCAGLNQDEAALMAWKLERRDAERDDRRLCIECQHLSGGAGRFRCAQWRMHQIISSDIPGDLVTAILHRCGEFDPLLPQSD